VTERRRFNARERTALYLAADGRCARCGRKLEPGWHADHVTPHAAGGPTDVINGQALCPPCNLRKGSYVSTLREWQAEALERFLLRSGDFLCVATPGAGKTRFALEATQRLIERGDVQSTIGVVPTTHLRSQWASAAARVGIQLDPTYSNSVGAIARDYDGVVVTYAAVASEPLLYRKLASSGRVLVILDEIHHAGDAKSWGDAIRLAFEPAARRLALSGTPFRSDGTAIPFVEYDDEGRCVPSYVYDYGTALADGDNVVRQIEFHAFDGEARWREATAIESRMRLSDTDEATRAKAMMSALSPDGDWIPSVLRQADAQLTAHREQVPDAGGLVVAADEFKARKYAAMLAKICGEKPTLAISHEPDASRRIAEFAAGNSRWIVAIAMVSEGVDIPRLAVGVYATNVTAELFFRQVVGRFVRTRHPEDYTVASLYIPSVQPLISYAAEIERMIPRALREAVERADRESKSGGTTQLEINVVEPLGSSEAVHLATILGGEKFADAELRKAEEMARLAGMPANVSAAHVARLMRMLTGGRTVQTTTVEVPKTPLVDEKRQIRKLIANRVGKLHRLTGIEHKDIHIQLNRTCGDSTPTADLDGLKKRLALLDRWIAEREQ
jgi:superfamily II DNA or RNA helicase